VIFLRRNNRIILKLFISSSISVVVDSITATITYKESEQKTRKLFSKLDNFQIKEGVQNWIFEYSCVELRKLPSLTFTTIRLPSTD